ncbi:MAG: Mo-dependent nitrogenase C-terminal domain-containing protein [Cyanobacteria bacterium J06639_1]
MIHLPHFPHSAPSPTWEPSLDVFRPLRRWIDRLDIRSPRQAHLVCKLIPCRCPFEQTLTLFGRTILRIPALCKLNPIYDELVSLRFRALSYLAEVCGEDVTPYVT